MGFVSFLSGVGMFLWSHFVLWLSLIFTTPFKNPETLWVLVPIYLGLVLAEIFQEKKGTSMGNAVSNAMIVCWGGIDFLRQTIENWDKSVFTNSIKICIAIMIIIYGLVIVVEGIRGSKIIKKIGRIREVSYVIIMFVPVYYNVLKLDWNLVIALFLFFPLFYIFFELLDRALPDPAALKEDLQRPENSFNDSFDNYRRF